MLKSPFLPLAPWPALFLPLVACAPDIDSHHGDDDTTTGDDDDSTLPESDHVLINDNGDGTFTALVDASSETAWVHLDLALREESTPETPESSSDWDLGFLRYQVKLNGGVSGPDGLEAAMLPGQDWDALVAAPEGGYLADAPDSVEDEDALPDYALGGWYDYDSASHLLTPKDAVYVLRSPSGAYLKLQFQDYYDAAGTSGWLTFRFGEVQAPEVPQKGTMIDASDYQAWVYLSVVEGGEISIVDPGTSLDWDLAVQRTSWQTNSGTSGSGVGGARLAEDPLDWEGTEQAVTTGYAEDEMIPVAGPPGSGEFSGNPMLNTWFNYDELTHIVTSRMETFLIRTGAGEYGKLRILSYDDGVYFLELVPLSRWVETISTVLDASDSESWIRFSFRNGEVVESADPSTDSTWDMGISRTSFATNGGTSGPGQGGAVDTGLASLAEVTKAPEEGYTLDEMIPVAGPPGSGEFSGNPTLATWYDYNPETHEVTPRDTVFVIRTADGGYAKVKLLGYDDGVYTLEWAYAGAGWMGF